VQVLGQQLRLEFSDRRGRHRQHLRICDRQR
jgi:hypothetical protein